MADNQDLHLTTEHESTILWPHNAVKTVRDWAVEGLDVEEDVVFYMVWFAFILGNWKALVSSTAPDGRYYEVTFNIVKDEIYVDTYVKSHNHKITLKKD